jgi:hypothetical protein
MTDVKEQWALKQQVIAYANKEATMYGLGTLGVVAAATVIATKRWEAFRVYSPISAKVSFAPMAALVVYFFKYESVAYYAQNHPEKYGLHGYIAKGTKDVNVTPHPTTSTLPLPKRVMNACYESPKLLVLGLGVPLAASILYQQLQKRDLTFSQRIMHSRIFAQFGILAIFGGSLWFSEYMRRHGGKYLEEGEEGGENGREHGPLGDQFFDRYRSSTQGRSDRK